MKLRQEIADLKLTDKQKRFCESYLEDFDAPKAVRRTGYGGRNASDVGRQLLQNENIQAYIAILKREVSSRIALRLEDVMREYMRVGFARIDEIASWSKGTVTLKPSKTLTEDQLSAIASVENTREGLKIKMHGKLEALAKLKEFCEEKPKTGKTASTASTLINIGEVRVALGKPETRKALDQVSSAFLGRRLKSLEHLDKYVDKVTNEIAATKPDPGADD